ncbi:DUF2523 family protein [Pseudoxanthomonas putridarboris]|uniref:DUF2523 family protein n=1 Tax=Pseudoxanthomonas putridarboris TaxID=752605 RepID=A0ABU9J0Z3_9GAMM
MIWDWIIKGIATLLFQLKIAAAGIVGRVLATFGLTMVTLNGVLPNLKSFVSQYAAGLSPEAMNFLGAIGLGQAMSMVLSALTIRLTWKVFIIPKGIADQLGGGS